MVLEEILNIEPDEKGIIEVVDAGKPRKFIKEKLVTFLLANGSSITRESKIINPKKTPGEHKRVPVIVITPDNKELTFNSSAEAATSLNICRTNIPHALSGRYSHVNGYRFKYANQNTL